MRAGPIIVVTSVVALLTGCSAPADPATDGTVRVVASTNVYGDVAEQVGGVGVEVTSIIADAARDPHEYEGDAQAQLAIAKADIVVMNGGGYDPFMDAMIEASGNTGLIVVNAVSLARADQSDPSFNEHVWYDLATVASVARTLGTRLGEIDPDHAADYESNAETFVAGIDVVQGRVSELSTRYAGLGIVLTEPVPLYLLEALGLIDRTPPGFSAAIEDDRDVPPVVLGETVRLLESGDVALLAYNEQTAGPQTEALRTAAELGAVPVVPVSETLPPGLSFLDWMTSTIDEVVTALEMRG